jgi:flagellar biosynthesis protein FlhF
VVTKTFRAETMLKALQMVQEELGSDAIVVSTREIPTGPTWNPWKQSAVEIVATTSDALPESKKSNQAAPKTGSQAPILRPTADKKGVEFVEETPDIEWVNDSDQTSASAAYNAGLSQTQKKQPNVKQWEPHQPNSKETIRKTQEQVSQTKKSQVSSEASALERSSYALKKLPQKPGSEGSDLPTGLKKIYRQLVTQGVDGSLINGLMDVALETLSPGTLADYDTCKKYITQLLGAELRVQQGMGVYGSSNIVCLIGASGSGKTSTLAKLVLFFGKQLQKNLIWVCADTVRIGAIAEARAYTDALGVELKLVYSPDDLKSILQGAGENDLFLLDTPGFNPCSENQVLELGALLTVIPRRCTYLVASATTKEADLFQLSGSFGVFNLDGLVITKLDETHIFGSVYNYARKNQVPLGFFTTGKETARNLEVVDTERLVSALFGKVWNK